MPQYCRPQQIGLFKVCSKCGKSLPATPEFFHRRSRNPDGLATWCKDCVSVYGLAYRLKHIDKIRARYQANKEEIRVKHQVWLDSHREQVLASHKAWLEGHREEVLIKQREYYAAHKEEYTAKARAHRRVNADRYNEYARRRLQENPTLRLNTAMRNAICDSLRGRKNGRHWEDLVDYTLQDLKRHLEARFLPGMTWENYGFRGWHIDHIQPQGSFGFETAEDPEFKRCWGLDNLRPLWAHDNISRGAKFRWKKASGLPIGTPIKAPVYPPSLSQIELFQSADP